MVLAAIRTGAAVLAVSLYVLLVGPPVLVWTRLSSRPGLLYASATLGVRMGFFLAGIRVRLLDVENIRADGAVYACNHTSNLEAPAVFLALRRLHPRLRVLYKAELRALPVLVWAFDVAGFVPVERANKEQSWPAVDCAADALRLGHSFFIFPEGTRSRTGALLPFKKGGFVMALKAQAPIVPVMLSGAGQSMRKGSPLIWPATVSVRFLPAVMTTGLGFDDRDQLASAVRDRLAAALADPC